MKIEPKLVNVDDFAVNLKISRATVFDWLRRGILQPGRHYLRIGRVLRFYWSVEAIEQLMKDAATLATVIERDSLPQPQQNKAEKRKNSVINWEY